MIRVEELTKVYKMGGMSVEVLRGINLTVDQGEFVAIIGPSGSGKSTLMNILGCLDVPSSGKYWLNDKEISLLTDNQLAEVRNKHIGFVFQNFNLPPRLSALEKICEACFRQGLA